MTSKDQVFSDRLKHLKKSRLGIIYDDQDPNKRSILFGPALDANPDIVNLAIKLSANNLFVALSPERTASFMLAPMARPSTAVGMAAIRNYDLNICVSVEAREGVTTGISASDRSHTIQVLGDKTPNPRMLVKPGHIFPVEVREGGVLVKYALPEGALDIVKIAGFTDAALFSDILNQKGELSTLEETNTLASKYDFPLFTLAEVTQHRLNNEVLIQRMAEAKLPTKEAGELRAIIYKSKVHEGEHLALVKGNIDTSSPTLTRIQLENTFADVFGGDNPASRLQIQSSLQALGKRESGVMIYLRRPFRGILKNQVTGNQNYSESNANSMIREYGIGSQILLDLGVKKVELLTNSPRDYSGVKSFGIEVVSQVQLEAVS